MRLLEPEPLIISGERRFSLSAHALVAEWLSSLTSRLARLLKIRTTRQLLGDFDAVSYRDGAREALRLLGRYLPPGGRVLDVGCGAGVQAEALRAAGYEVFACDRSVAMAALANSRVPGRVMVAAAEQLPFDEKSFDAVFMLEVIGYSPARWRVLAAARRVLRDGGLLVISTANRHLMLDVVSAHLSRWPELAYRGLAMRQTGAAAQQGTDLLTENYAYADAREFDVMLARHGFRRLEAGAINFGRLRFMGRRLWPEVLDIALSRALTRLARHWRTLQRGARIYVGCYRKR